MSEANCPASPEENLLVIIIVIGDWRSWLARAVWDREVAGSSPASPTKKTGTALK